MESVKERYILLRNRSGMELPVLLRAYREGDEAGMIACIREEYGETYFRRKFYDPQYLRDEAGRGRILFLVAQTLPGNEIAGMMILKSFFPEESMCEIASQIFRKKYRGYGLAGVFFDYGLEILRSGIYSATYCLPVLFHDITQRLLYRRGLRAAGFLFNVFDMAGVTHSYPTGRNEKHSQGIQIMALDRRDAGTVYIPREHHRVCGEIYESLGVNFHLSDRASGAAPERTVMLCRNDDIQHSLEIRADVAGIDFGRQMCRLHSRYLSCGRQTFNVLLNCSHDSALYGCEILRDMGYFFAGLKPLCSGREYMVMHHPGGTKIYFEDYAVSGEFGKLLDYVRECCAGRRDTAADGISKQ